MHDELHLQKKENMIKRLNEKIVSLEKESEHQKQTILTFQQCNKQNQHQNKVDDL